MALHILVGHKNVVGRWLVLIYMRTPPTHYHLVGKRPTWNLVGHFAHEPRFVTMKMWEPKRNCPKAVPWHFLNHVVWSWTLKCSVKSCVTGPSTRCHFNELLFMWGPHTWKNRINQQLWVFGVPWSPHFCIRAISKKWVFKKSPSDHETWSIRCLVGNHANFTSILHSHTPLVPQA